MEMGGRIVGWGRHTQVSQALTQHDGSLEHTEHNRPPYRLDDFSCNDVGYEARLF